MSKKADGGNTSDDGNSGATLKDRLPKFSNFDPNGSVMETPRRFSKHPSSWGQKNQSLSVPRLSFGINTKYTSVFGNPGRLNDKIITHCKLKICLTFTVSVSAHFNTFMLYSTSNLVKNTILYLIYLISSMGFSPILHNFGEIFC